LAAHESVELSNGALLTADTDRFDRVFRKRPIDQARGEVLFTPKGKIVDEKPKMSE